MKILYILLICTLSYASESLFLLPKQYDEGVHHLLQHLSQASSRVTILTQKLNHYEIKKKLFELIKQEVPITFITASHQHMGVQLVQYKNFELHTLDKLHEASLNFSLILIDDTITCKFSSSLDKYEMKRDLSLLECGAMQQDDTQFLYTSIMPYTTPYLKEHF